MLARKLHSGPVIIIIIIIVLMMMIITILLMIMMTIVQTCGLNGGVTLFLSRSDQLIELKNGCVFTALQVKVKKCESENESESWLR